MFKTGFVTSVSQQKKRLRTKTLRKRDELGNEDIEAKSAMIFTRLKDLKVYKEADVVGIFVTYRSEMNTYIIMEDLLKKGKKVAVPRVTGKGEMEFHLIKDPAKDLEKGSYGIMEPLLGLEHARPEDFDLLIVPGAAFDCNGFRIGYGGGFYDRYLKRLRQDCATVGLGFELQVAERVPAESFDSSVDFVVTEQRVIRTG